MGKRKTIEEEISSVCQSIGKRMAVLSAMIEEGQLSDALTTDIEPMPVPEVVATKKHRGTKPAKDPLAPARNLTSYIHYTNENRRKIVEANPTMAPRDVARTLGEGWRALSSKEKARYDQLAKDDLKRYNDEMKAYKEMPQEQEAQADDSSETGSVDEEDELASDDTPPKVKHSSKKLESNTDKDDTSDSSSSSGSSSDDSSSSSDSSDSE